eukprot:1181924-Prorocentrum_minimum.AAC.1
MDWLACTAVTTTLRSVATYASVPLTVPTFFNPYTPVYNMTYVVGDAGVVLRSTNGGETFTRVTGCNSAQQPDYRNVVFRSNENDW